MPIRRNGYSLAFRDFERSHQRAVILLRLERSNYKDPPPSKDQTAVDALRGGATVLMVASIEQYLKSALEEFIEEIELIAKLTSHSNLPPDLRELNDIKYLTATLQSRASKQNKLIEIRRLAILIAQEKFIPESFSRTQANPGPSTVATLFKDFGISDPFSAIESKFGMHFSGVFSAGYVKSTLDNIVTSRNQVAHGQISLNKSRADLKNWINFSYAFGKAADNVLRDRAMNIIGLL